MALPKQTVGLTNFKLSISKCPPNPDAIRAIVFTKCDNLSVVNGANTEIQIPLTKFFVPVENAARLSFSIPAAAPALPYTLYKLDLGGVDIDGGVKFISIFPDYGTGNTATGNQFVQWTNLNSIDEGVLYDEPPIGPSGSTATSFSTYQINQLEFSWGGYLTYNSPGSGYLYAATNGGLLRWDGYDMKLWNTLNSGSPSDYISCLAVNSSEVLVGSNRGISVFTESQGFYKNYTTGWGLPSDNITGLKMLSTGYAVAATDKGFSIFHPTGTTFSNYNIYNSPLLKHNYITKIAASEDLNIFAGTTGGVYMLNSVAKTWLKYPLNSTTITGWSAPDDVTCIDEYNGNLYVGTTGGVVIIPYSGITGTSFPYAGVTATTVIAGASGPYSNYFSSLRIEKYNTGSYQLFAGHGGDGIVSDSGWSIYDIDADSWFYQASNGDLSGGPITDVLPDYLSGASTAETLFIGNAVNSGIWNTITDTGDISTVPGTADGTNILLTLPKGLSGNGNYIVDDSRLYGTEQPLFFLFSKDMTGGATSGISFENFFNMTSGIDGTGSTVSGTWTWGSLGTYAVFTPDSLEKAKGYNFTLAQGSTAADGTYLKEGLNVGYYTENISPVLGWNYLGKMLTLSGTDGSYVTSIYLRNPQSSTVNFIALIGR